MEDPKPNYDIQVNTIKERNAIPPSERAVGLICYVLEDDTIYYLKNSTKNYAWNKYQPRSGIKNVLYDTTLESRIMFLENIISSNLMSAHGNEYHNENFQKENIGDRFRWEYNSIEDSLELVLIN